nr:immunoglobulin heavy chain junction region [Macaca mulatta]MOW20957.1 immunoglobulin heavy chain junction region [Macaca mulatta]
CTRSDYW